MKTRPDHEDTNQPSIQTNVALSQKKRKRKEGKPDVMHLSFLSRRLAIGPTQRTVALKAKATGD